MIVIVRDDVVVVVVDRMSSISLISISHQLYHFSFFGLALVPLFCM